MRKFWLPVGFIAFVSVLIVIALVPVLHSPREPEYHGKKLTTWLDDLSAPSALTRTNATLAIQQMGTNAVPFLVQMTEGLYNALSDIDPQAAAKLDGK
ncbi:MAG TPA: hypothetical protein VGY56_07540 [Verrucomicrobiae bacterium]|nr:hypothetical protein [Verrucomicrobiae bacterium]